MSKFYVRDFYIKSINKFKQKLEKVNDDYYLSQEKYLEVSKPKLFKHSIWNTDGTNYKPDIDVNKFIFGFGNKSEGVIFNRNSIIFCGHLRTKKYGDKVDKDYGKIWGQDFFLNDEFYDRIFKFKGKQFYQNWFDSSLGWYGSGYFHFLDKKINTLLFDIYSDYKNELKRRSENEKKEKVRKQKKLEGDKLHLLSKLDKDNNGTIDVIEGVNEFNQLMKKNQKSIIEKQRVDNNNYSNQLIKISNYIRDKKHNLQELFQRIKETKNKENLDVLTKIISNEVHVYNLILFNSLNLLVSIIDDDLFTYNDIYEKFDKMNIFNSNFENELSKKLDDLNLNLVNLMFEIDIMGRKVVNSINHLSYVTEESSKRLEYHLKEINSGIESNNFLSTIQTYQLYKINKNTKSLRN